MIVLTTVSDVWFPLSLGVSYTVLFPSDFFLAGSVCSGTYGTGPEEGSAAGITD